MALFLARYVSTRYILFFLTLISINTLADTDTSFLTSDSYSVGLDLGMAKPTSIGDSTSFPLGYSTFSYSPGSNDIYTSISGISLNKLFALAPAYTLQVGLSYHYISRMNINGNLEQGITPPRYQSSYSYRINSSQYLVEAGLFRQFYDRFFPYIYLGAGVASNSAYDYSTTVPAYLTVTPDYSNKTRNSFTYSLGLGVFYFIAPKVSLGLGYRFIDLGRAGLSTGIIRNTPLDAKLTQSNLYMNALLAQINYFI
jgi:opacity protein-like surface antigen